MLLNAREQRAQRPYPVHAKCSPRRIVLIVLTLSSITAHPLQITRARRLQRAALGDSAHVAHVYIESMNIEQ
jgi:hypothetical protein